MDVRVICPLAPSGYPETDYVRVQTCADPFDDTVTLATIERVVDRTIADESKPRKRIKTLIMRRRMSQDEALGLATSYAEAKKIPVVYSEG